MDWLLCPWDFPGESAAAGCQGLLRAFALTAPFPCGGGAVLLPTPDCSLLLRMTGAVPGVHGLEAGQQQPGCRSPTSAEPCEKPTEEEALESGPRTVSRRYLSSLKNKLSSGAWRKSYQPRTCPGSGTQVPEGWGRSGVLGGHPLISSPFFPGRSQLLPWAGVFCDQRSAES